jgi:hypothetical protein
MNGSPAEQHRNDDGVDRDLGEIRLEPRPR